jgi:hypothetical protein
MSCSLIYSSWRTSCPTECYLSYSDEPWNCIVSLRIVEKHGKKFRKTHFGETIYDVATVTERIRRAQRAILNLSTDADMFLKGSDEDLISSEKTFSADCICLEIKGKDVPDLSFIDLPGLSFILYIYKL